MSTKIDLIFLMPPSLTYPNTSSKEIFNFNPLHQDSQNPAISFLIQVTLI